MSYDVDERVVILIIQRFAAALQITKFSFGHRLLNQIFDQTLNSIPESVWTNVQLTMYRTDF